MARVYVHDAISVSDRQVRWIVGYSETPEGLFEVGSWDWKGTGFFKGLDMRDWDVDRWVNIPDKYWDAEPGIPEWLISVGEC